MPNPVSVARQCLAGEAAAALDEAVAVARRRAHAQTTSLHVVSALLSLPSSSLLRDALSRARSAAFSPRLQLKALDLSFSVALDRLPSAAPAHCGDNNSAMQEEPPVSNSLMAAIKRSQANQRRNPDTFHLYHHYQQQQQLQNTSSSSSSFSGVKVELRQLVLSILDDPVVSRVLGEAGFRSCDVKFAILRPPPSFLRFPRSARCPPLFLCNFSTAGDELDLAPRDLASFPVSSQPLYSDAADENCRRVAEVLVRKTGRNPLLVGVGASEAARDFERVLRGQKWAAFPPELCGVEFLSIERELSEFVRGGRGRPWLGARFGEVGLWLAAAAGRRASPGVVLGFGELEVLVDVAWEGQEGDGLGGVCCMVSELTRLVEGHQGRLWLMGSVATYETYMKFLAQYPSVDKDWDLQLLPVTSIKPGSTGLCSKPSSLMESFVPFGGLFPVANNSVAPLIRQNQSEVPCHLCNDLYDQEIAALLNEFSVSVEEKCLENLPQMHQIDPTSVNGQLDVEKTKDDGTVLNVKIMNLRKKWIGICQHLHQGSRKLETDTFHVESKAFLHAVGLSHVAVTESSGNETDRNIDEFPGEGTQGHTSPGLVSLQKSSANKRMPLPVFSKFKTADFPSKPQSSSSKGEQFLANGSRSHSGGPSDLGAPDEHTSSSPVISVSTDLMLGTVHSSLNKEEKSMVHLKNECLHELPAGLASKKITVFNGNVSEAPIQYSSCLAYSDSPMLTTYLPLQTASGLKVSGHGAPPVDKRRACLSNICEPFDISNLKTFSQSLAEKVSWQEEATRAVSHTLARCRTGNERLRGISLRGDIWLSFLGPDRVGKRKIAMALAELLFGSREKLITVDLSLQDGLLPSNTICSNQDTNRDLNFRGKTVADHIAEEIGKKPCSVVLLENVDKADLLVQSSLSRAIKTGKFSDSYRREVGINNAIFVVTAGVKATTDSSNNHAKFSEEQILAAESRNMMILADYASDSVGRILCLDTPGNSRRRESRSEWVFVGKQKINMTGSGKEQHGSIRMAKRAKGMTNKFLDLNLPVEEAAANGTAYSSDESGSTSENTEARMEEFLDTVDETVLFKPFDFDALADDILKEINRSFQTAFSSNCVFEIDQSAMEQILAAAWLSEGKAALGNWLQHVLVRSLTEARKVYNLSCRMVLRLVACEDSFMEDHAPGILLPSQILLG